MISVEVFSDVVCPWCFIGKRNLEKALTSLNTSEHKNIKINWRSFQLNPQLPMRGITRSEYTSTKFGGAERAAQIYERISGAAMEVGLNLDFEKIVTQPNSSRMHALVYAAESVQKDHELVEGFFKAFFIDGMDLTERDNVSFIAKSAGLETTLIDKVFSDDLYLDKIDEDMQQSAKIGIQGVPFFIINQKVGLSGAQPPENIVKAIEQSI